jgi:general L-amino acid transport system substrate-binding protein
MRRFLGLLVLLLALPAASQTLDAVRARGELLCGVHQELPGFAERDAAGTVRGLDADTCRAIAAAALGDAAKVRFVPLGIEAGFAALSDGSIDVLVRYLVHTLQRDAGLGFAPAGVNYIGGQSFLVPARLNVTEPKGLAGRRICVLGDSVNLTVLEDFLAREAITAELVPTASFVAYTEAYAAGRCDAVTAEAAALAAARARFGGDPAAHAILPDRLTRDPVGPYTREADPRWRSIVQWTVNALLETEALGITAANLDEMRASRSERIRRLLGALPGLGAPLGLSDDWVFQVVREVGTYGEMFERNLGGGSPLRLARELNALHDRGGLLYPIPMR